MDFKQAGGTMMVFRFLSTEKIMSKKKEKLRKKSVCMFFRTRVVLTHQRVGLSVSEVHPSLFSAIACLFYFLIWSFASWLSVLLFHATVHRVCVQLSSAFSWHTTGLQVLIMFDVYDLKCLGRTEQLPSRSGRVKNDQGCICFPFSSLSFQIFISFLTMSHLYSAQENLVKWC